MRAAPLSFKVIQGNFIEDARNVEDKLQRRILHLELGRQRLFRKVGQKFTNKNNLARLHQVFLTYRPNVAALIADGTIIVDDSDTKTFEDEELVEVEDEFDDEYHILCNEKNLDAKRTFKFPEKNLSFPLYKGCHTHHPIRLIPRQIPRLQTFWYQNRPRCY